MPQIAEPLRPPRILAKPKKFAPLRGFSVGGQGNSWEKHVNDWARSVYLGVQLDRQTVVVLEDAHGKLIGASSYKIEPLPGSEPVASRIGKLAASARYIHMLGIDRRYHGQRLQDGSRLGDVLLRGTLDQIERTCERGMPHVWALITPENARARVLFARHGFEEISYTGDGEITYARYPYAGTAVGAAGVRLARWIARARGKPTSTAPLPPREG